MAARFDGGKLLGAAKRLGRTAREIGQVQQRAIGTLRRRLPVEARRDIQGEYNIAAGRVSAGLSARPIDGGVELRGSSRGVGLLQFGGRQTATGVAYSIRRGVPGARQGAFIQRVGGNSLAFSRAVEGGRRVGRYPIVAEYGPSVAQMLGRDERRERLADAHVNILTAEIERLLRAL